MDVPLWYQETAHRHDIAVGNLTLSPEEAARAGRFLRAEDRRDYIVAHCLLREALSQYQPAYAPDAWRFETNSFGKPSISTNHLLGSPMEFSLSHTRGFVACAVAPVRIGIDVEWLDREVEVKISLSITSAPRRQLRSTGCLRRTVAIASFSYGR